MSNQVVLRPLRFTADVPAMRRFLETLGLKSRVESEHGGWVDMVAGRGMVALHDSASSATGAKSGETGLSFEADDIEELKERLQAAGYQDATVWDEAYGRVLSVTAPVDAVIWVDQRNDDLYGYKLHAYVAGLGPRYLAAFPRDTRGRQHAARLVRTTCG